MNSFAILTIFITAALAQSASPNSTVNPLIPSDITSSCSSFLASFNTNTSLSSCTQALISATSAFGPTSNSSAAPSTSTITTALNNFCGVAPSSCPPDLLRGALANFYSACPAELTNNPNKDVIRTYDVLYALTPLQQAVCSKDDSGRYCVTEIASSGVSSASAAGPSGAAQNFVEPGASSTPDLSDVQKYLYNSVGSNTKRDTSSQSTQALVPNSTTYANSNVLFLFLQPTLPSAALCTTCTRSIFTAYINFESSLPYAPGLSGSELLSGQSAIYSAVQKTCGTNFLSGAVQAAGGLGSSILGNGAGQGVATNAAGTIASVLAVIALGFTTFF